MSAAMIRAIIFDMDGVLIDSEPVYQKEMFRRLSSIYPFIEPEDLAPLAGLSPAQYIEFFSDFTHLEKDDPEFIKLYDSLFSDFTVDYTDILRPETPTVLQTVKDMGLKIGLASSSPPETIKTVVDTCGIRKYFDVILSGEEFPVSKPDPAIYLGAAKGLGCQPEECLIVEDSTNGISSAVSAGIKVLALKDARYDFDQSKAWMQIDSIEEVPGIIRRDARNIRAAFFDIDDTLTYIKDHKMPDSTRSALSKLREKGISVILSTGRHRLEVEEENILPDFEYDGAVWLNGQLCELNGREIRGIRFTPEQLDTLKSFLEEYNVSCIFLEKDKMYCNFADDRMRACQEEIGTAIPPVRDLEGLSERKIYQVIPYIDPEQEVILRGLLPECQIIRWGSSVTDMTAGNSGKDKGILAVCEALDISADDIIAFGDGANDASMLNLAGIGVAMGNAIEETKKAADYVTDPINEDGIYNALKYFALI